MTDGQARAAVVSWGTGGLTSMNYKNYGVILRAIERSYRMTIATFARPFAISIVLASAVLRFAAGQSTSPSTPQV